jgi:hypothetical protein
VDHVVREKADRPALESGKARHPNRLELLEKIAHGDERIALRKSFGAAVAGEREPTVLRREDHQRIRAQERISRPHLAALDRFQQERVGAGPQPEVCGEGRVEIGRELSEHGHKVAL